MNGHAEPDSKQKGQPSDAGNKDSHAALENSNGQQSDAATGDKASSSRKPQTIDPHHGSDTTVSPPLCAPHHAYNALRESVSLHYGVVFASDAREVCLSQVRIGFGRFRAWTCPSQHAHHPCTLSCCTASPSGECTQAVFSPFRICQTF